MNHRNMRKVSYILPVALLVAGVLYRPCYCQTEAGPALENPRDQVNKVLLALPDIEFPAAGRGTAIVMWDTAGDKPADLPRIVDFAFKGPKSRSDVFAFVAGQKGSWLYSHAITDEFHFGVNARGARISYHPRHNQIGEDFHPAVFLTVPEEAPIEEELKWFLRPEAGVSAETDATGILHLVHRWNSKNETRFYGGATWFSFDTRKGYLPVLIGKDLEYYEPPAASWRWVIKFQWIQYGSTWYIGSAERQAYRTDIPGTARPCQLTITEFDPNAEVSDEEFSMEALGAWEGMTVVEASTGFSHVYTPPVATLSEWEEPPKEVEPAPNAEKQESPPSQPALDPTGEQTPSEPAETADSARVPLTDQTSAWAPPGVSGGTPGAHKGLSHEAELAANAGKQPGGPASSTPQPAAKAHATESGHLPGPPHREVRIHTLLGLFLLLGMLGAVAYVHAHIRPHHRQQEDH